MKNYKILYILIGALCLIAIIAGIYAQFFVKAEDKNNVIIPNLNQDDNNNIVAEKTTEEIKSEFSDLFTNVFNSENYDTSTINKTDSEKDIVYTMYTVQEKKDNYEINIHMPVVNIQGEVPYSFNLNTQNIFANKASDILSGNVTVDVNYQVNYTGYINGNILSLVIEARLKEGSNPQRVIVATYNYNLETGEEVKIADLISEKGLIQSDVQKKINETVQKSADEAEILAQSGYAVYNRDLGNDIYKINNISTYFLGPNGQLYIIFAYGNNNYTSEMDIVLYE